jgi:hypothetical protein
MLRTPLNTSMDSCFSFLRDVREMGLGLGDGERDEEGGEDVVATPCCM